MEEQNPEKGKGGRPSIYTPELADRICGEIALGYSLRTISKDDSMPCVATVFSWLRTNKEFLEQYERAKELQADMLAEDLLDIADDGSNDWMERTDKEGQSIGWQLNGEHVQRSRLRIDTRKWIASKLKAKKYGDATLMKLADSEGQNLQVNVLKFSDDISKSTP